MILPIPVGGVRHPSAPLWALLRQNGGERHTEVPCAPCAPGTYLAATLSAVAAAPPTWFVLGDWGIYAAILCGLVGGHRLFYRVLHLRHL